MNLRQYEEEGFLVLPEVLRSDEVAAAAKEIERLHQVAAADPDEGSFQFEPFTDTRAERGRPVLRKIEGADRVSELFHSNIVHGSGPNRSDRPRHTALYAYFPPNVRYVPSDRQPRERQYRVVAGLEGRRSFTLRAG